MTAAFSVVFAVFVLAFVVLAVVSLRWAVRRDKVGRAEWLDRRRRDAPPARSEADETDETDEPGWRR